MKKIGLLLLVIGAVAAIAGFKPDLLASLKISLPDSIKAVYLQVSGLIVALLGIIIALGKKRAKQGAEVPIYQGNKIIGYRR